MIVNEWVALHIFCFGIVYLSPLPKDTLPLMHKIFTLLSLLTFFCSNIIAQQNCMDAIPICQNSYSQTNANAGVGSTADLTSSNQGCLTNGEVNASWYILNASTAGNIIFNITPNSATDDYDFAVWDITDTSCGALASGLTPLRCNFASLVNSSAGGLTGLNTIATQTSLGGSGPSYCAAINASAGQTFVILVNNNSGSANGYTIDFSGSTALIIDNTNPTIKNVIVPPTCGGPTQVKVLLKENVKCSSIAINGSDFTINNGYNVTNASGSSCAVGGVFSSSIYLTFNAALAPGNYTITINNGTDGNTLIDNCNNSLAANSTFSFTVLPPLKVIVQPQFGCGGGTSGTITASGSGGYLPYKYKLNNGVYTIGNAFASLSAGTYTVYIKDSLGCVDDTVITLSAAAPIVLNGINSTNLTCYNSSNGTITVSAAGGSAPLIYAVNSQPYSTSNIITNLVPGTYVVHTKDANGCIKDSIILITSPGPIFGVNVSIANVSCLGLSNGSINYIANGGNAPLQYALNAGSYSSFANYSNLPIGVYTLHIKDANNCLFDTIITITQPSTILGASIASLLQPNCSGTTGSISAIGVGGTSPYTYSINGTVYSSANSFTGLSSGSYTIYVKDAGACIATATALLVSPGNLSFAGATVTLPTCVVNGSITVTAAGGTAPLTYANGTSIYGASNSFVGLPAGSYTLHVKDNNNCIHDTIITLQAPPFPQIVISNLNNATCSSPNSGSLSVISNGGFGAYTYSINGSAFTNSTVYNSLSAGNYTIVVKDANGCTSFTTASIISNNTIAFASVILTNVGCGGNPLGTVTVLGIGGNNPYQYKINANPFQSSGGFTNLSGGNYTITVQDANGCTKTTIAIVQSSAGFLLSSYIATNATCSNPGNGSISVTVTGGVAPVVFNLNGTNYVGSNFNGLPPGNYTFTATDANGCTVSSTTILTGPPYLWFGPTTVVFPPCFGGIGSIVTSGIGGSAPYSFSLDNSAYAASSSFLNLPAGTYVVHVKDANGCIHDTTIVVIQPNPVLANNLTISNAACNGNATGSISVTGGGTIGPYQYKLNNGTWVASNSFINLAAGTYTVFIKDANGCTASVVASINNNGNFYFNTSSYVLPSCINAANGSITFSGTLGALPYQFKINAGAYQTANTFSGLASGTYTLYVKDNAGCVVSQVLFLPNPPIINFSSIAINSPFCFNGTDASIIANGSGGTGALLYRIDGGVFSSSASFTGLSSGVHTLSIKDANNCIYDSIVNISNPLPIQFSNINIIQPGCFGPGNGSISVQGVGGVAPYSFSINGGVFSTNNLFNPLLAAVYTIAIKDANNCTNSTTILLTNSVGVNFSQIAIVNPLCLNTNNGTVTVTATSNNPPLNYSINGSAINTTGLFSNLGIGTYTIHAADNLGCYKDSIVTLVTQSNLKIDSTRLTKVLCPNDSSGTATIYASGGNGALTYNFNTNIYQTNNLIAGLNNTTYTLHAKDAIGCIVDTIITIGSPAPLYFSNSNITLPYCNGSQDGIITIGASGGVGPYLYAINSSAYGSTTTYNNLIQSMYTFHVKDANGCQLDTSIFLQGPEIIYFSSFGITNISCFGASNGSAVVSAAGGLAPYQYALNNNAFSTINNFANLPAGQYSLTAIDNQGCLKDTVFDILAPASLLQINVANVVQIPCRGDSTGSFSVSGIGGTGPYTYSFMVNNNFTTTNTFNNLYASNFNVYIKDANGCLSDTIITILEPDSSAQVYLVSTSKNSCIGVYDAILIVSAKNGFAPYTYSINGIGNGKDSVFENLGYGDYVVEVTDSIGCKSTGKYFVDSTSRKPSITMQLVENNICKYDEIGKAQWTYVDAYPPVLASVNGGVPAPITQLDFLKNGNYTIESIDDKGCKAATSFNINFSDSLQISITTQDAQCSGVGDDGKVSVTATNGAQPYQYFWSFPAATNLYAIDKINAGAYSIVVKDSLGCVDSTNFIVAYYPCCNMWLPNVFSPNKDDLNDLIGIIPSGPVSLLGLEIYNRWGNQVFATKEYATKWDGSYQGVPCEIGTYFYVLKYTCSINNKTVIKKGDITLVR
jgi:large repetitive protein